MFKYFKAFWWIYVVKMLTGLALIVAYLTNGALDLVFLFKVPLIGMYLVLLLFQVKYPIRGGMVSYLLIGATTMAILVGAMNVSLDSRAALVHFYAFTMAIFAVSMGYHFAQTHDDVSQHLMARVSHWIFIAHSTLVLGYMYLHYVTKQIAYFGFDSELPFASAFALGRQHYGTFMIALVLVFFSGKRAPLISMAIIGLAVLFRRTNLAKPSTVVAASVLIGLAALGLNTASDAGLLYRFEETLAIDVSDEDQFFLSTSGRSTEVVGLFTHVNAEPVRWVVGSGLGATYELIGFFRDEAFSGRKHYTHISVLNYLLVSGLPVTLAFLSIVGYYVIRNAKWLLNRYYLAMVVTFIGSTFGASLLVEPIFWFMLGMNIYMARAPASAHVLRA